MPARTSRSTPGASPARARPAPLTCRYGPPRGPRAGAGAGRLVRMRTETASLPGDPEHPNEDWVAAAAPVSGRGGVLVVLDGVTPPSADVGCTHPVPWFTARLGGALTELSASRPDLTLAEILAEAIRRTADSHSPRVTFLTCELLRRRWPWRVGTRRPWSTWCCPTRWCCWSPRGRSPRGAGRPAGPRPARGAALPRGDGPAAQRRGRLLHGGRGPGGGGAGGDRGDAPVRGAGGGRPVGRGGAVGGAVRRGRLGDCVGVLRREGPRGLLDRVRALEARDAGAGGKRLRKRHDDATAVYAEL